MISTLGYTVFVYFWATHIRNFSARDKQMHNFTPSIPQTKKTLLIFFLVIVLVYHYQGKIVKTPN